LAVPVKSEIAYQALDVIFQWWFQYPWGAALGVFFTSSECPCPRWRWRADRVVGGGDKRWGGAERRGRVGEQSAAETRRVSVPSAAVAASRTPHVWPLFSCM